MKEKLDFLQKTKGHLFTEERKIKKEIYELEARLVAIGKEHKTIDSIIKQLERIHMDSYQEVEMRY